MKLLIWLLKKYYTNRKAYALNEYRHYEQKDSKTYESFWTIEHVLIKSISIDANNKTEYMVMNLKTGDGLPLPNGSSLLISSIKLLFIELAVNSKS